MTWPVISRIWLEKKNWEITCARNLPILHGFELVTQTAYVDTVALSKAYNTSWDGVLKGPLNLFQFCQYNIKCRPPFFLRRRSKWTYGSSMVKHNWLVNLCPSWKAPMRKAPIEIVENQMSKPYIATFYVGFYGKQAAQKHASILGAFHCFGLSLGFPFSRLFQFGCLITWFSCCFRPLSLWLPVIENLTRPVACSPHSGVVSPLCPKREKFFQPDFSPWLPNGYKLDV